MVPIHFIDFEGSRATGVVEYGVVTLAWAESGGWGVRALQTRLCRPDREIPAVETAVHGIETGAALALPPFAEEYERFVGWRREGVFAAHHHGVEQSLLKQVWPFPPFVPDWSRPGQRTARWAPWIDTLRLAQRSLPGLKSHQLSDVVQALELVPELEALAVQHCPEARRHWHCAPYDALASALIYRGLARRGCLPPRLTEQVEGAAPDLFGGG